jgi:hypothetical protein
VIFWNTGFRAALKHLAPLHLRTPDGGIAMDTEVAVRGDPRIFLVGYGSASSTVGATRAGRIAARELLRRLSGRSKPRRSTPAGGDAKAASAQDQRRSGSLEFVTVEADGRQHLPELFLGLGHHRPGASMSTADLE